MISYFVDFGMLMGADPLMSSMVMDEIFCSDMEYEIAGAQQQQQH